jgi:hypothetical protein
MGGLEQKLPTTASICTGEGHLPKSSPTSKSAKSWAPGAHACNPSYSGGRDQDYGLKPAWANSSLRPYLNKALHKKGLVEWLKV